MCPHSSFHLLACLKHETHWWASLNWSTSSSCWFHLPLHLTRLNMSWNDNVTRLRCHQQKLIRVLIYDYIVWSCTCRYKYRYYKYIFRYLNLTCIYQSWKGDIDNLSCFHLSPSTQATAAVAAASCSHHSHHHYHYRYHFQRMTPPPFTTASKWAPPPIHYR